MHPIKRPKAGETEEELMAQEKEFLESLKLGKVKPAASVVRAKHSGENTGITEPSTRRNDKTCLDDKMEIGNACTADANATDSVEYPADAILMGIKERSFDESKLKSFSGLTSPPKITRIKQFSKDCQEDDGPGTRKKSLFAKSFDARQDARRKAREQSKTTVPNVHQTCTDGIVSGTSMDTIEGTGSSEAIGGKIHPYLAGMTEDELLEEQRKMIERLGPSLTEFVRNRHMKTAASDKPAEKTGLTNDEISIDESDLPINPQSVGHLPGMSKVELPKLAWTGVLKDKPVNNPVDNESKGKNARFGFDGLLISDDQHNDKSTYEKALHNHGEEMDRAGYTLEELLTLARSSNLQQRSIALTTLGNIYQKAHTGIYDIVLEKSVFYLMDYMELIYVIRKGLDNTDSGSINSSLKCLAALIFPEQEEAILDATYLWPNSRPFPLLSTKPEELTSEESVEMKDFEFLKLDLLEFLLKRSELLTRLDYLLTSKSDLFNEEGIIAMLKILIRFARHSPSYVVKHVKIVKYVVENHISPNWAVCGERNKSLKGTPLAHALKFVRILVESCTCNAFKLYNSFSIFSSVMSYLAYDQWREQTHVQDVENLVLESFKIWIAFLTHRIAIDEYVAFFPVVMQFLKFYGISKDLNSFDLCHSAHLFAILTEIISFGDNDPSKVDKIHSHWSLVKDTISLAEQHCYKLLKVLSAPHLADTLNNDLALLSLGKGLEFLTKTFPHLEKDSLASRIDATVREFINSNTYNYLTKNLISHSVLLMRDASTEDRYLPNFASLNMVKWQGELNPLIRSNTPYHFLGYFLPFSRIINQTNNPEIVLNSNIVQYLSKLSQTNTKDDTCDYLVRFELSFLSEILRDLPATSTEKFPVSYNVLARVPKCCPDVFKAVLNVSLGACCNPKDLEIVSQFFTEYYLKSSQSENNENKTTKVKFDDGGHPGDDKMDESKILFETWSQKFTERHWILDPLENVYKNTVSTIGYVQNNLDLLIQETRGYLSFIEHCLRHFCDSIIQSPQDLVTVYCSICRTFMLGSPAIYMDELSATLLIDILSSLLKGNVLQKMGSCSVFSRHKPSTKSSVSFLDFYTELVQEYFYNSYFNEIFTAYLFLPLRSPEDSNVKLCLWNHEDINCIRLKPEKIALPVTYFMQRPEKDVNILRIYGRLIRGGVISKEKNTFLYEVVLNHLKNSSDYLTDELRKDFNLLTFN